MLCLAAVVFGRGRSCPAAMAWNHDACLVLALALSTSVGLGGWSSGSSIDVFAFQLLGSTSECRVSIWFVFVVRSSWRFVAEGGCDVDCLDGCSWLEIGLGWGLCAWVLGK